MQLIGRRKGENTPNEKQSMQLKNETKNSTATITFIAFVQGDAKKVTEKEEIKTLLIKAFYNYVI